MKVAILTVSDKGSRGERVDESGAYLKQAMSAAGAEIVAYEIVPDEKDIIQEKLINFADNLAVDLVLTTGGTGLSPRDVTPEATLAVIDRKTPGFGEAMRQASLKVTPHAMLSRAESGIRGKTLIINLPGSLKAVKENLEVILPALPHAIEVLRGEAHECGHEKKQLD